MARSASPPLWLPEGSLRALITMSLLGATVYLCLAGRPVPEVLGSSLSMALGLYFGHRQTISKGAGPVEKP